MSKTTIFSDKYFRVFLIAVIVFLVVITVARHLSFYGNALLVLLGFGAVVIVHEFGHFIVAKISGIKVEAFSLFMPPILLGIQKTPKGVRIRILPEILPKKDDDSGDGALCFTITCKCKPSETEYRVGLIPFGGFVKMLGQDDIFTRAMIETQIKQMDKQFERLMETGIPQDGIAYMGMTGFRIRINVHGEILEIHQPGMIAPEDE